MFRLRPKAASGLLSRPFRAQRHRGTRLPGPLAPAILPRPFGPDNERRVASSTIRISASVRPYSSYTSTSVWCAAQRVPHEVFQAPKAVRVGAVAPSLPRSPIVAPKGRKRIAGGAAPGTRRPPSIEALKGRDKDASAI